jgi:hypothetical protein
MGRWAQRTRSGGGITPLNFITTALAGGGVTIIINYSRPVDGSQLDQSAFTAEPEGEVANNLTQFDEHGIELQFPDDIAPGGTLVYDGSTPGILTPQTVTTT